MPNMPSTPAAPTATPQAQSVLEEFTAAFGPSHSHGFSMLQVFHPAHSTSHAYGLKSAPTCYLRSSAKVWGLSGVLGLTKATSTGRCSLLQAPGVCLHAGGCVGQVQLFTVTGVNACFCLGPSLLPEPPVFQVPLCMMPPLPQWTRSPSCFRSSSSPPAWSPQLPLPLLQRARAVGFQGLTWVIQDRPPV